VKAQSSKLEAHGVRLAGLAGLIFAVAWPARGAETNTVFPLDLPTALRLAGAQNIDVLIAREKLSEARANHAIARAQFFPWVTPGVAFRRHENNIQDIAGTILNADKNLFTAGANLTAQVDLGEAIYRSLAARQLVKAAEQAAEAQRQDSVFGAAAGYFDLVRAQAGVGVASEAARLAGAYARQLQDAVGAGVAFKGDAARARAQWERTQLALRQAQEQQRVASARLAQVLRLDPTTELMPDEGDLAPLELVEHETALDSLVSRALNTRPELKQGEAQRGAADAARKGARYGPLIPSVGASLFYGGLGGGPGNPGPDHFTVSEDYFIGLGWRIGPGGLFDPGRIRAAESRVRTASLELDKVRDAVTRQVVEAHVRAQSLADQIATAKRALEAAEETAKLSRARKQFGVGAVLEDLQAEQELTRARQDYVNAVAEANKAQYELQRAIGAHPAGDHGK
jgi:outer membrane protein TolC